MIKILFVCHGNICISPMAEFLLKKKVKDLGVEKEFKIDSAATSSEEIGNGIHDGVKIILDKFNIDYSNKIARQVNSKDYEDYDIIIGMDDNNINNLKRVFYDENNKIKKLLNYAGEDKNISDPWYTGDFEQAYKDINYGLDNLLKYLGY